MIEIDLMTEKSKKAKLERELGNFLRLYQRKAQRSTEPNDRGYSRKMEKQLKNLKAESLSDLLCGTNDTDDAQF